MNYGEKIKLLRQRKGETEKSISKILDIDQSLYAKYENDKQTIPLKHLITLCNYHNISLDYVFNFTNIKQYKNPKKTVDKKISGQKLKEFRKENKLTQNTLAKILNTTQSVIADYERGRYLISTPFIYTICTKYHISADYLLGRTSFPIYLK